MSTMQSQQQRGGCLTIWLVLAIIGGILSAITFLGNNSAFMQVYPGATTTTFIILAVGGVLITISAVGMWMWKRWGFYLYIVAAVVDVIGQLILGSVLSGIVGALIAIAILWFLIRNKWASFV